MGLTLDIQKDLIKAFNTDLKDAVKSFTLKHRSGTEIYDATLGQTVASITDYIARGVFTNFTTEEKVNSSIKFSDVKLIIIQSEITIEPEIKDQILEGTKLYEVVGKLNDPAGATYELQLRTGSL